MLKRWRLWALRRSLTSLEEEHPSANGDDEWDLTLAAETILLPSFTVSLQHHLDCTQLFVCRYRHCGYIAVLDLVLLSCVYRCCVSFYLFFLCFIDQSAATRQIPAHLFYLWKWNGFNYSVESLNIEQTCVGTLQSSFKRENGLVGSERLGPVPWTCDWNRVQTRFCFLLKPWRILTCGWKDCDRFSS